MTNKIMRLYKVTLENGGYWSEKKGWAGKAYFRSPEAAVDINITEEHARKILMMCADQLIDSAKEMSEIMRDNIIEGMPLIDRVKEKLK